MTNIKTSKAIDIYFAPIVALKSYDKVAYKAQVRIFDDNLGVIMPQTYIHISDRTAQCKQIFKWTIEETIAAIKKLDQREVDFEYISIYGPQKVFEDDKLIDNITKMILDNGLTLDRFGFEVYPEFLLEKEEKAFVNVSLLREKGCRFILLNFASENFPISKISLIPVDVFCLDSFLIKCLDGGLAQVEYAQTIISMAKKFDKQIFIDGINTPEQYEKLSKYADIGCGEYFGKYVKVRSIK